MDPVIQKLVDLARSQVGARESGGNNRGERVREYQAATWLSPAPWPWCAAFTAWLLREWTENADVQARLGLAPEKVEKWRCKDASAYGWETWAAKNGYKVLGESALARAGDFVTFDFSHIGLVIEDQIDLKHPIHAVEGNTNGKGERDSTSGDGVWEKHRNPTLVKRYIRLIAHL